jgi:hypothetical protein
MVALHYKGHGCESSVCLLLNVRVWEFVKVLEEINFCKTDMLLSFLRSTSSRGVLDTTLGDKVCQ